MKGISYGAMQRIVGKQIPQFFIHTKIHALLMVKEVSKVENLFQPEMVIFIIPLKSDWVSQKNILFI